MIICQDFIGQEFHNMNEDQAAQFNFCVMYITIKVLRQILAYIKICVDTLIQKFIECDSFI